MAVAWKGEVKVQRSITTSEPVDQVLITSKDGAIVYMGPLGDDLRPWFGQPGAPDEYKFFAFAIQPTNPGPIDLKRKVRWRYW